MSCLYFFIWLWLRNAANMPECFEIHAGVNYYHFCCHLTYAVFNCSFCLLLHVKICGHLTGKHIYLELEMIVSSFSNYCLCAFYNLKQF